MHNDDTTLIIIQPDETKDLNSEHEDNLRIMINLEQAELAAKSQQEKDNDINSSGNTNSPIEKDHIEEKTDDSCEDNTNVGVASSSVAKPNNKCDSSLVIGAQLTNNENEGGKSINVNEQFKIDFIKNLDEELAKGKHNKVLNRLNKLLVRQNQQDILRNRNIRIYFENALDKTLKKYEIIIKI